LNWQDEDAKEQKFDDGSNGAVDALEVTAEENEDG
jgi:hypothetical protein